MKEAQRLMSDFRFFVDESLCRKKTFKEIRMHLQMIYGDHKVVKYMVVIFMYFSPRISLLTLRCFVAEVRWLFPVNHQEY